MAGAGLRSENVERQRSAGFDCVLAWGGCAMKLRTMPWAVKSRFLASLGMTSLQFPVMVFLAMASGAAPSLRAQVTPQRLLDSGKEPQNWMMYSGDYAGRRVSALEQINTSNAAKLVPAWGYQTMAGGEFETTALVADGILYGTVPENLALASDATSGRASLESQPPH